MTEQVQKPNFAELSDAEIMNLDPSRFGEEDSKEEAPENSEMEASAESEELNGAPDDSEENESITPEEAGGAEPSEGVEEGESEESDAAGEGGEDDTRDPFAAGNQEAPKDDQSKDKATGDKAGDDPESGPTDYEAAYRELMAPFKAARREVKLDNIEDARRLMQMGVDYSSKMRQMKPHLRVLRTLEKAGLTDPDQINFLIDLKKGDTNAIKKLLKDGSIDPMELDLEGSESYKPNEHVIGDVELGLAEAFDSISESPHYQSTLKILDGMDTVSKQQLQDNPNVIPVINQHMEAGIYEKVWAKVEMERMLGRLAGLSDLDAYYRTGEAMHKAGLLLTPAEDAPSPASNTTQGSAQGNGSPADPTPNDRKGQKRAASPTKGRAAKADTTSRGSIGLRQM